MNVPERISVDCLHAAGREYYSIAKYREGIVNHSIKLGRNLHEQEVPQAVVRAGCFFGATVNDRSSCALVGCTVAPGFDFADFELADRAELCRLYPQHRPIIESLTRSSGASRNESGPAD